MRIFDMQGMDNVHKDTESIVCLEEKALLP